MKINGKKLRKIISESIAEILNPIAYPNIAQPDFGDSVPAQSTAKRWEVKKEPIERKIRRSIFNTMANYEGQHEDYTIEDISADIADRYGVSYDIVHKIAKKCLKSRRESGEADFCVPKEYGAVGDGAQRVYKKVDESIMGLSDVSETPSVEDFYNYVVNRFREEGIEIGDAGDDEELLQGCGNYDYETVPFEQLYPEVKRDWIAYKSEQNQYHGINESLLSKLISESITKILMEDMLTNDYPAYVVVDDSCDAINGNYDNVQDAVNDADESARNGGSYSVFGCVNDVYDDDTLVYCTSGNRDSWKF